MGNDDALFRYRLAVFALATELGNVRAACRMMGIHHPTFYVLVVVDGLGDCQLAHASGQHPARIMRRNPPDKGLLPLTFSYPLYWTNRPPPLRSQDRSSDRMCPFWQAILPSSGYQELSHRPYKMTPMPAGASNSRRTPTQTSSFGVGRRENHDSSVFYARFSPPLIDPDERIGRRPQRDGPILGDARSMTDLPDHSVALMVTSPPYFVGKEYENEVMVAARSGNVLSGVPGSYRDYLRLLHDVFQECYRVLEPGGRMAVNVANLGRKPYRSLSADVIRIFGDLGLFLRGEIIWRKAAASSGSCAWGSFRSPSNPVLRDVTERVVVASKGRFDRALPPARRQTLGLPHVATTNSDEFMEATLDVWTIPAENARRVGHPAPFPVELPLRLIHLYTYEDDLVLDPFLGSGTTLLAARRASRRGIGYDIDPEYVQIAEDRLQQATVDTTEHRRMSDSGSVKGAGALTHQTLEKSGFTIVKTAPKVGATGVSYDFFVENQHCQRWYVNVAGGLTTVQPGLQRSTVVWETLGKAHVLHSTETTNEPRILVITPKLPKPASPGRKAINAVGPRRLFDVIELSNASDLLRLQCYGTEPTTRPTPGFWTTKQISCSFPTDQ